MIKELKVQDLYKILEAVQYPRSTGDTIHTYSQNPLHVLVYNEMMKYTKEELENITHPTFKDDYSKSAFYDLIMQIENPFFYGVLIKKGACKKNMKPITQWFITEFPEMSLDLTQAVYRYEKKMFRKNGDSLELFTKELLDHAKMESDVQVLDKFYKKYVKNNFEEILNAVFTRFSKNEVSHYLLDKMKKDGLDINSTNLLNNYLPQSSDKDFFISSSIHEHIKEKLDHGFRFDETHTHHGKTLVTAILESGYESIVQLMLPTLKNFHPLDRSLDDQTRLLEKYKRKSCYNDLKLMYYERLQEIYETMIPEKSDIEDKIKIKI